MNRRIGPALGLLLGAAWIVAALAGASDWLLLIGMAAQLAVQGALGAPGVLVRHLYRPDGDRP